MRYYKHSFRDRLFQIRQLQPPDVAEVLTVGQVLVLRIHADGTPVESGLLGSQLRLEGVVVALTARHLQRFDVVDALLTVLVGVDVHLLQGDDVVESLFVDDIFQMILLSGLTTHDGEIPSGADNADAVPTLGHNFLPLGNILSQLVVVLGNLLEALSLFVVELLIIASCSEVQSGRWSS